MDNLLFRASTAGHLMVNPRNKADKEAGRLGKTAITHLKKEWLKVEHGVDEPLITEELDKGNLCQEDANELADKVIKEKEFRTTNEERLYNDYFTGLPDVVLKTPKIVEDMKVPFTIRTYMEASLSKVYYCQLQVYMNLLGFNKARLIYAGVNTPLHIVAKIKKKFWYKHSCDILGDTEEYLETERMVDTMHNFDRIPLKDRVKFYEFQYNESYIDELKRRIDVGRKLTTKYSLNDIDDSDILKILKEYPLIKKQANEIA